jgi:hypothetical protein
VCPVAAPRLNRHASASIGSGFKNPPAFAPQNPRQARPILEVKRLLPSFCGLQGISIKTNKTVNFEYSTGVKYVT